MSAIKQDILDLSQVVGSGIEVSKEGDVTFADGTYQKAVEHLGVDFGQAKKVNAANVTIATAMAHAGGEKAVVALGKNKDLDRISGKLREGNAEIWFDTKRETQSRNPRTGETSTNYGTTQFGLSLKGMKGAQAAAVKQHLTAMARAKFGK